MMGWRTAIKQHIEDTGQNLGDIAERVGLTEAGLRHWLNGTRVPNVDKFLELCAVVKADPGQILASSYSRLETAKALSPAVNHILTAKPQGNPGHQRLMGRLQNFKAKKRQAKVRR